MRSKERSEWLKSAIRLKQQEEIIEKTVIDFVNSMKLEPEILRLLHNERHACATERKKFSNSLRGSVFEIVNDLKIIESIIDDLQKDRRIDVDGFKSKLETLASKIRSFNEDCPLEKLAHERSELEQYLREFSTSLIKYETRYNLAGSLVDSRRTSKTSDCRDDGRCRDYKEIRNFDALVAKTGHTQNWTDEDHLFFLKVRKNCRNVPSMVSVIRKKCPDLSAECIVNHEAWYKIYVELRESQRKAIEQWRNKKQLEKTQIIDTTMKSNNDDELCNEKPDKSRNGMVDEEATSNGDASKRIGKFARPKDSSTNDKREMINRWRLEKEKARNVEHERAKSESELRKIGREDRRLARAKQIKATVSAWKEKKDEHSETKSTSSVTDSDRAIAKSNGTKLFKFYRIQDEEFLKRRKSLLASKSKSNSSIPVWPKVRESSNGNSTLLKPTKVWIEKCKRQDRHSEISKQVLYIKDIPKLATCRLRNVESS